MADDDASRRPPQAYATVSPAGVCTTTTNQVSPGTVQEILDTGDQNLIDQAFDQMSVDDLTSYLQSLPSPSVPAGVGSQASRTPSTGARTPHRGSPRLSSGARTPRSWGSARLLAAAGAGGGGDGSGNGGSGGGSRRSTPVEDRDEDGVVAPVVLNDPPRCLGLHPDPHNKAPLEVPGPREDLLEPWVKRIYNDAYVC